MLCHLKEYNRDVDFPSASSRAVLSNQSLHSNIRQVEEGPAEKAVVQDVVSHDTLTNTCQT